MLGRGLESDLGVVRGVLRDLEVLLCDGAVGIQVHRSIQLLAREKFIGDGLAIGVETAGHIVASNGQQQLAFFHGVAEPRVNGHDTPRGERDHRDVASNIRRDRPRNHQLGGRGTLHRRRERKLLRMVHREQAGVRSGHDVRGRWRLRRRIGMRGAAYQHQQRRQRENKEKTEQRRSLEATVERCSGSCRACRRLVSFVAWTRTSP